MKVPGLKPIRLRRGWTQEDLSRRSGVSRDSLSNYENDSREPHPTTVKKLATALGVSTDDLQNPTPKPSQTAPHLEANVKGLEQTLEIYETLEAMLDDLEDLPADELRRRMTLVKRMQEILRRGLQDSVDFARELYRVETGEEEGRGNTTTLVSEDALAVQ